MQEEKICLNCGEAFIPTCHKIRQKYCSRFCCLLTMDQTHEEVTCEWCGEKFTDKSRREQRYCSRSCAVSARFIQKGVRQGSWRINAEGLEEWKAKLAEAARGAGKRGKRVRLVCGRTSMYTGLDGLLVIIQYHLKHDPYDGSVYVFRDGMGFQQGKRRAQSGSYPWPKDQAGEMVEINEKEWTYLLSKSIVSRAGVYASKFLEGFSGYLHTDGYDAYHCKLPPEITTVGCWAHMCRKFTDTLKSLPKEVRERSPAQVGLDYCGRLFHLEKGFSEQKLSFQERYQARLEQSKPLAEKFFAWAAAEYEKDPVPKSMLGAALTYAVDKKARLMNIFLDGRVELSNNRVERAVRPFAVGRKNWLFSNTPKGADAGAAVYSIVETAKANGLRPYRYLKFLLERLSAGVPADECFPWSVAVENLCK